MPITSAEWKRLENIQSAIEDLDSKSDRLAFAKKILGDGPLRRSYFRQLVNTTGIETFSTLWNSAIRNIDDSEISLKHAQTLWEYAYNKEDKQWLRALIQRLAAELGIDPFEGEADEEVPPPEPAVPPVPPVQPPRIIAPLPPVRFRLREVPSAQRGNTLSSSPFKIELIREDSTAKHAVLNLGVVSVPMLTLTEQSSFATYFGNRNQLSGLQSHHTETLMQDIGTRLFSEVFKGANAQTELHLVRQNPRRMELVIEGSFKIHRIPWELIRYTIGNQIDLPFVHEYPVFRQVTTPAAFSPREPASANPLQILWVSARHPKDIIPRDAVQVAIEASLQGLPVHIDFLESGSFVELNNKLAEHADSPKYHVLHLDMHGEVTTAAAMRSAVGQSEHWMLDYRPGGLGSMPNPGNHQYEQETTYLWFNHQNQVMPVSSQEIASRIAIRGVPLVVLNACSSARVPYSDASLVASLVQAGGFPAVGFQQPTTVAAAIRFFQVFYKQLAGDLSASGVQTATHKGRMALLEDSNRGPYHYIDWWLPALYAPS